MVDSSLLKEAFRAYLYVALWIVLSGSVITYNKFILSVAGFPYPISLTLWHMFSCSSIAFVLVRSGTVKSINMDVSTYISTIVPIGACYSVTLWIGNAAYLYLSVSFIQMLKALMPVSVFTIGCLMGTEKFRCTSFFNMCMIALGVAIASYGELNFNMFGVMLQLGSIVVESVRLVLVQLLLQSRGMKLNPITTLYYVSPCCFAFLLVPFFGLEWLKIVNDEHVVISPFYMITNAAAAFCLNLSVFLLIGKTSALTMNVAGVVKDWLLIGVSVWVFHAAVSPVNLGGYLIALLAVFWYNYEKYRRTQASLAGKVAVQPIGSEESEPLVPVIRK